MPNCEHGVLAKLLQGLGVISVLRYEVEIGANAHVEEPLLGPPVELRVLGELARLHELLDEADAVHATCHVLRVAEVVESDVRVVLDVGVHEGDLSRREGLGNLLEDEASPERLAREASLPLLVRTNRFVRTLLGRDC